MAASDSSEYFLDSLSKSSINEYSDDSSSEQENEGITSNISICSAKMKKQLILHAIALGALAYYETFLYKTPVHDRNFSGWAFLLSILNGAPKRCHDLFRMHKHVFFELCSVLVEQYGLKIMSHVSVEEQVAIFLMIVGMRHGNRSLQEIYQRSGFTISRSFHNVLRACTKMSIDWIRQFEDPNIIHPYIRDNPRYFPHFKDCIGAIDGTHIKARVPIHEKVPYIGRKGIPTQNIMAVCDFNLCFTFVLPGWEGSAHDTRIFNATIRDPSKNFPTPPSGKYYLIDAGYPNILGYLSPYKGQRYHLLDFDRATSYRNASEVFNHSHSALRSHIERTFGVWKTKFYMVNDFPVNISWPDQVALVAATMALHNFIRLMDAEDDDFVEAEKLMANDTAVGNNDQDDETEETEVQQHDKVMDKMRDDICTSIVFGRIGVPTHQFY